MGHQPSVLDSVGRIAFPYALGMMTLAPRHKRILSRAMPRLETGRPLDCLSDCLSDKPNLSPAYGKVNPLNVLP